MFEILPPVVLAVALLVCATLGAGAFLWFDGRRVVAPSTAARRAVRHAVLTAVVAAVPLVVGLGLPLFEFVSVRLPSPHLLAALPMASLVGVLAVYAVGEVTWPKPQGATRQATLTARTAADVAPPVARTLVRIWAGATVVAAIAFALVASGPRRVSRVIDQYDAFTVGSFPGWLWTGPIVALMLVVLVLCEVVLKLIASRPAVLDVSEEWDMWLRRRVARRVLRLVQLVIGLTLAGLVALAGTALRKLGLGDWWGADFPPSAVHTVAGISVQVIAVLLILLAIAVAVWPARDRAPVIEPARPLGATP